MLKITNLSAAVDDGNKAILTDLSLEVPAGEGLMGLENRRSLMS